MSAQPVPTKAKPRVTPASENAARNAAILAAVDGGKLTFTTIGARFGISDRMVIKIADKAGRPRRGRGRRLPCAVSDCTNTHYEGREFCYDHSPERHPPRPPITPRPRPVAKARSATKATNVVKGPGGVAKATLQALTRRASRAKRTYACVRCGSETEGAALFCGACR